MHMETGASFRGARFFFCKKTEIRFVLIMNNTFEQNSYSGDDTEKTGAEKNGRGRHLTDLNIDELNTLRCGIENHWEFLRQKRAPQPEIDKRMKELEAIDSAIKDLEGVLMNPDENEWDPRAKAGWSAPHYVYGNGPEMSLRGLGHVDQASTKKWVPWSSERSGGRVDRVPNTEEEDMKPKSFLKRQRFKDDPYFRHGYDMDRRK